MLSRPHIQLVAITPSTHQGLEVADAAAVAVTVDAVVAEDFLLAGVGVAGVDVTAAAVVVVVVVVAVSAQASFHTTTLLVFIQCSRHHTHTHYFLLSPPLVSAPALSLVTHVLVDTSVIAAV